MCLRRLLVDLLQPPPSNSSPLAHSLPTAGDDFTVLPSRNVSGKQHKLVGTNAGRARSATASQTTLQELITSFQTHVAYAARPQSPTSLSFTHVNARGRSGIYTRTGELPINNHRALQSDGYAPVCKNGWHTARRRPAMYANTRIPSPRVSPHQASGKCFLDRTFAVYSKDMPERLPLFLILRQFSRQLASAVLFSLRAVLVASIWLAALPWVTIWTWRMYFAMGNHAYAPPFLVAQPLLTQSTVRGGSVPSRDRNTNPTFLTISPRTLLPRTPPLLPPPRPTTTEY